MTGSPNFRMHRPRKQPNKSAQISVAAIDFSDVIAAVCLNPLKMQFQQAYFQGESFLNVGVEQALGFFERLKVFEGLT